MLGDFNIDQRSQSNVDIIEPLLQQFGFVQCSKFTTHIHGGILDLIFDNDKSAKQASWIPTPFSDHFTVLADI